MEMRGGVKVFSFRHTVFNSEVLYTETEMPSYVTHKDNKWFLDRCILTLEVGGFVDTDFHRITRVE